MTSATTQNSCFGEAKIEIVIQRGTDMLEDLKKEIVTVPLSVFLRNLVSTIAISYLKTLGRIHTGNPD